MNHYEATKLDQEEGDAQWTIATKEEMDEIVEIYTFGPLGNNIVPNQHLDAIDGESLTAPTHYQECY